MSTPVSYPRSLPAPQLGDVQANERRLLSPGSGPFNTRPIQRDWSALQTLQWTFNADQAETFNNWFDTDIIFGCAWFSATWPLPQGVIEAVRKFTASPKWAHLGNGFWRVSAVTEIRGRGEVPIVYDPYCDFVILLMPMAEDFLDKNGHWATAYAGAAIAGGVAVFDGANDFVSTDDFSDDFLFDSDDFSIECYINPTSIEAGNQTIACMWWSPNYASDSNNVWRVVTGDTGSLVLNYRGQDNWEYVISAIGIVAGVDQHIAVVKQGGSAALYINGQACEISIERSDTGSVFESYEGELPPVWMDISLLPVVDIGRTRDTGGLTSGGTWFFGGTMHDLRITRGVPRYTASFVPPVIPLPFCIHVEVPVPEETIWDHWDFESGTTSIVGDNGNVISLYNDDSQQISSSQAFTGTKSVRKGAGSAIQDCPTTPEHANWEFEFHCYFPSLISGSTGKMLVLNRFQSYADECIFEASGSDQVITTGDVQTVISVGAWHKVKFTLNDTLRIWEIDDAVVKSDSRADLGYPASLAMEWQFGRDGYDYYFGDHWFIDDLTISFSD